MFNSFLLPYEKLEDRWDPKAYAFLRAFGNTNFEFVKIGKLLENNRENISLEEDKFYKQITIKIYHKGVILRGEQKGRDIKTRPQFKVKAGQFILSKIDAKDGAFGIIPDYLDGGIITGSFVSFDIKRPDILSIDYFDLLLSQDFFLNILKSKSVGTTGRKPIMIDEFLDLEIPLPPLDIQEKIVETYNNINNEIKFLENENKNLDKEVDKYLMKELGIEIEQKVKKKFFCVGYEDLERWDVLNYLGKLYKSNFEELKMKDIAKTIHRGKSPKYDDNGTYIAVSQKCVGKIEFDLFRSRKWNTEDAKKIDKKLLVQKNDILINSTGEGTIGRVCIIDKDYENCITDSHVTTLRVNINLVLPIFVTYYFNTEHGQTKLSDCFSGGTKQKELTKGKFECISFPIPPLDIQKNIINGINNIKNKSKLNQYRIEKLKVDLDKKIKGMILYGKGL